MALHTGKKGKAVQLLLPFNGVVRPPLPAVPPSAPPPAAPPPQDPACIPGTPAYDVLRLTLRAAFGRAFRQLSGAARAAGMTTPLQISLFNAEGLRGLYGGRNKWELSRRKGASEQEYWDRASPLELDLNILRMEKTRHALNAGRLKGDDAIRKHAHISQELRTTFARAYGGRLPERLPLHEHIGQSRRRLRGQKPKKRRPVAG